MAQNFIACDREQQLLLPPSLREWLPRDHLAWFVLDAVDALDLAAFFAAYRVDGWGRAAHDPAMMVALLVYAYAVGERSSRRIERRCHEDVATRDYEQIAREILEQAAEIDALEDEQFGERRGDELPPELSTPEGRQRWLRDARRRLEKRRAQEARPVARSRAKRLLEARRRLEENLEVERRANAEYEAYRARGVMKDGRRFGRPPKRYRPPDTPAGKINLTDPDSRNVKTPRGWVQGYNVQASCSEKQIVIAAEVTIDSPDFGHLEPMIAATKTELAAAGVDESPAVVLADAGYWHQAQMERITGRGTVVLVPPDAGKRKGPRPGWDGGLYAFMRRVLATEHGGELYRKRKAMIEPVFGDMKFNRRIDRFF